MLLSLIFLPFIQSLSFEELKNITSQIQSFKDQKILIGQLTDILVDYSDIKPSSKYTLEIKGMDSNADFSKVVNENSANKFYVARSKQKVFSLTYNLPEEKCINGVKFVDISNKSENCIWLDDNKLRIKLGTKQEDFNKQWTTNKCVKSQSIIISSSNIPAGSYCCFGDIMIED